MSDSWIALTPSGVVVARRADDGLLVDRPGLRRFREPTPLHLHGDRPVVDGVALFPLAGLPSAMATVAGWYDGGGRQLLLTQIAEHYFGEPMVLLAEAGRIQRAYGLDETRLLADDGTMIFLDTDQVRLAAGGDIVTLHRSTRYREERVSFRAGEATLAGTVLLPATAGPHPAAVVLHGAAFGQRDSCRLQAAPLLAAGLAVLIYDKAGHGESTGPADPTIFDQADAAEAGLDLLAGRSDVDSDRIGLAGFSNGMWSAPMVAARRSDVAFVAGMGSPGVSMAESEAHRRSKALRDTGVSPATAAAAGGAWRCLFQLAGAGPDPAVIARLEPLLAQLAVASDLSRYPVPEFARREPMLSPVPPDLPLADLIAMITGERSPELIYDPAPDYGRLACPVLLQYGSEDTSVPVAESVRAVEAAMPATDPPTVLVYPGLEHMLNVIPTGFVGLSGEEAMYLFHDFHFGPTVLADLTRWLRDTVTERPPVQAASAEPAGSRSPASR